MKIGVYENGELQVYSDTDSVLIVHFDDEEKKMISNMCDKDNTFLTTKLATSTAKLSSIIEGFKKCLDK